MAKTSLDAWPSFVFAEFKNQGIAVEFGSVLCVFTMHAFLLIGARLVKLL
jgi:hypothetical protein